MDGEQMKGVRLLETDKVVKHGRGSFRHGGVLHCVNIPDTGRYAACQNPRRSKCIFMHFQIVEPRRRFDLTGMGIAHSES
jgi:hypothetical protein